MRRSGKFYRKNEAEVMKSLGLKPTRNSGSGWVEKEDGQSEHVICQLKSTDAKSIRINQHDLHILEYNASVSHKTPVFAVQFIQGNEIWLMVKPEDLGALQSIVRAYEKPFYGAGCNNFSAFEISAEDVQSQKEELHIVSSKKARENFMREIMGQYQKKGKGAI